MVIKPSLRAGRGSRAYYPDPSGHNRRTPEISSFEHRFGRAAFVALCGLVLWWLGLQLAIPAEGIMNAMVLFGEALRP